MQRDHNGSDRTKSARRAAPPPPVDRACGVGLCDVLRIELDACQIESLRDEIDELKRVLDEAMVAAAERGDDDGLNRCRYDREVLDMVAGQLAGGHGGERVVVVGPAAMLSELVGGAARDAGERLVDHLAERRPRDGTSAEALVAAAELAAAWARTYAAVNAVETYSFDPAVDPAPRR